jgi:hypothetical protein
MKRMLWAAFTGLSCLAAAAPARAMLIAPAPIPQRVATAEVVVVGKVTGFADKTVSAPVAPGSTEKMEYQIALIKVGDVLLGDKDAKEIKVGFPPPAAGGPIGRPGGIRRPPFALVQDQEACFLLSKNAGGDFYAVGPYYNVINKKAGDQANPDFDKELAEVKRCLKLLADSKAALTGNSAEDRTLTAEMLVARYRLPRAGLTGDKTEDLGAEESKLILKALADADWDAKPAPGRPGMQMSPLNSFFQLGLTEKDGWAPPKEGADLAAAAKKWLKENADKYRLQRLVPEKADADKKDDK